MDYTAIVEKLTPVLQRLGKPISLVGVVVLFGGIFGTLIVTPDLVISQVAAGIFGTTVILFGLIFFFIGKIPVFARQLIIPFLFVAFLIFFYFFTSLIISYLLGVSDNYVISPEHKKLHRITSGYTEALCRAETSGSAIQRFSNGWMVARFETNQLYAIYKAGAIHSQIYWERVTDTYSIGENTLCDGVYGESLLEYGFRKWYCSESAKNLRSKLGIPTNSEELLWIQFQNWERGVLIFGLPGAQHDFGGYHNLSAVFASGDHSGNSGAGLITQFSLNDFDEPIYCTAMWFPAQRGANMLGVGKQDIPDVLKNISSLVEKFPKTLKKCASTVGPSRYIEGSRVCSLSGF